jgi:hypothetical protein
VSDSPTRIYGIVLFHISVRKVHDHPGTEVVQCTIGRGRERPGRGGEGRGGREVGRNEGVHQVLR